MQVSVEIWENEREIAWSLVIIIQMANRHRLKHFLVSVTYLPVLM